MKDIKAPDVSDILVVREQSLKGAERRKHDQTRNLEQQNMKTC